MTPAGRPAARCPRVRRPGLALALTLCCLAHGIPAQGRVDAGEQVAGVAAARFLDARWQPRRLAELPPGDALVVYFATVDCPMVRRYMPRLGAIARDYSSRGVTTLVVNVGAGDAFVDAVGQQVEHAPAAVFAKDHLLEVAAACGVDRSGAAVIIDRQWRVRYAGRIDDQHGFSVSRDRPQRNDLKAALDQVLAGEEVDVTRTEIVGCRITSPSPTSNVPVFSRDVAPILQRHCVQCHDSKSMTSFPLVGEAAVRKHAAMIGEVVALGRMPPWSAAAIGGPFVNRRGLSLPERETVLAWVAGGAPKSAGEPFGKDLHFPHREWSIGAPDRVLDGTTAVAVAHDEALRYRAVAFAHEFTADTWVDALEVRSTGGSPLHHVNLGIAAADGSYSPDGHIGNQVMHGDAIEFGAGQALRIPAGSRLVAQLFYVPEGRSTAERVQLALRFPRTAVTREVRIARFGADTLDIPPNAAAHRVEAEWTLPDDAIAVSVFVQMHLRGRDVRVVAELPDGVRQPALLVPTFQFGRQETYVWWRGGTRWPRGTRLYATAHFDNSAWNIANPDPAARVRSGPLLSDERFRLALTWAPATEGPEILVDPGSGTRTAPERSHGHPEGK